MVIKLDEHRKTPRKLTQFELAVEAYALHNRRASDSSMARVLQTQRQVEARAARPAMLFNGWDREDLS